jgi:hypothetical protein
MNILHNASDGDVNLCRSSTYLHNSYDYQNLWPLPLYNSYEYFHLNSYVIRCSKIKSQACIMAKAIVSQACSTTKKGHEQEPHSFTKF